MHFDFVTYFPDCFGMICAVRFWIPTFCLEPWEALEVEELKQLQVGKGSKKIVPSQGIALGVQDQTKWLVFRMIHKKDSLLPMGKVWSLDFLDYFS